MIALILAVMAVMFAVMGAAWVVQRRVDNAGWVDVFWTYGTGATCALAALAPAAGAPFWRQALVAGLVAVWALRLGTYVALRVAHGPEDARYAGLRTDWGAKFQLNMVGILLPQAPATALLSISVIAAAHVPFAALRWNDVAGALILVVAIAGETLADRQMKAFKADPNSKGRVCERGLWGWSRHPNYFFEWFGWLAYPVIGLNPDKLETWLTLIAPVAMFLILRFATGVPPLEAAMVRSKGEAYRRYQARVSPFLLLPPRGDKA